MTRGSGKLGRWLGVLALLLVLAGAAPLADAAGKGRPHEIGPEVVGGTVAKPGYYPYMVSLQINTTSGWRHNCGGSLLDETHVLTAAHCVAYGAGTIPPQYYRAVIGRTNLKNKGGTVVPIASIVAFPGFDLGLYENDVAVMTLARPYPTADYYPGFTSVFLPDAGDSSFDRTGQDVIATGWGSTVQQDGVIALPRKLPNRLQWVALQVDDVDACAAKYNATGEYGTVDPETAICASYPSKDTCQGDSGGPLVVRYNDPDVGVSYMQVGIVSNGRGCAWPGWPGIYTKVSAPPIRDFIQCVVDTGEPCKD